MIGNTTTSLPIAISNQHQLQSKFQMDNKSTDKCGKDLVLLGLLIILLYRQVFSHKSRFSVDDSESVMGAVGVSSTALSASLNCAPI